MDTNKDDEVKKNLPKLAKMIHQELPKNYGFCLFTFGFNGVGRETMYIANGDRADIIKMLQEFIIKSQNSWGNDTGKY